MVHQEICIFNPNQVRSIHAAFDPDYRESSNLLASKAENKLLAPNGKPSNLNAMQHAQVRTEAFKKWFGDWENDPENASKVVDENGEPKVVYRGYGTENPVINSQFTWVSEDKKIASGYADSRTTPIIVSIFAKIETAFNIDYDNRRFSPREFISEAIKSAPDLSNKSNVLAARAKFLDYFKYIYSNPEALRGASEYWGKDKAKTATRELVTALGYDGIQLSERAQASTLFLAAMAWATFEPNQIKSATVNNGDFSPTNNSYDES